MKEIGKHILAEKKLLKKIELDYIVIFNNDISYTISFLNINMLICQ